MFAYGPCETRKRRFGKTSGPDIGGRIQHLGSARMHFKISRGGKKLIGLPLDERQMNRRFGARSDSRR